MRNTDKACVKNCTKCPKLVESRSQIVNGVGPLDSELVIVGEAPGQTEDETGEPFVGRSGTVLDDTLQKFGFSRSDVRITNTVRCRPPENRDPYVKERNNCYSHLVNELEVIEPNAVLTLGNVPTQTILDEKISITEVAGKTYDVTFGSVTLTVVAGIHPAATLYNSSYKDKFEKAIEKAVNM